MTCQEFVDFLMHYLDDELAAEVRASFEAHLGECPTCVAYLDTYRETVRLGRDILCGPPDAPVPDDVPEELVAAICAARER